MLDLTLVHSFSIELQKIAATRYEKEISKGNITRSQVTPGVPELPGPLKVVSKKITRNKLWEHSPVSTTQLARKRQLASKLYKAQLGTKSVGKVKIDINPEYIKNTGERILTAPTDINEAIILVPKNSASIARQYGSSPIKTQLKIMAKNMGVPISTDTAALPVDSTLNYAILQHELGEAATIHGKTRTPFSSHLGIQPILREQQALSGDPEAVKIIDNIRQAHPDDALATKWIRQAGGRPDSPLPIQGRAERSLMRTIARNYKKLNPATKINALQTHLSYPVSYVPASVDRAFKNLSTGAYAQSPGLLGKAKALFTNAKPIINFVAGY